MCLRKCPRKWERARFRHPDLVPKSNFGAKSLIYNGALGGTRTPDTLVRSQVLYPAELRARRVPIILMMSG